MSAKKEARTRTKADVTSKETKVDSAEPAKVEPAKAEPVAEAGGKPVTKVKAKTKGKSKPAPVARKKATKLSALEAAVRVLGEEGRAMNCQELIATMAAKGYWKSPGGKTPASTLYASLLKEITTKGKEARFVKVARGQFALRASA